MTGKTKMPNGLAEPNGLIPAAQYLRMSTNVQMDSFASQDALNQAFAERHGYEIIKTYSDAGKSGLSIKRREGLRGLLRDVLADPPFAAILVTDVSRWGRFQDPDEGAHYEFLCRKAGVRVLYCAEAFENDASQGASILKTVKRVMAAEYSRQLSERIRAGIRRVQVAGGVAGSTAPYGFTKMPLCSESGLTTVHHPVRAGQGPIRRFGLVPGPEEELKVLRRIFTAYGEDGLFPAEIARELNAEGHDRRGKAWIARSVVSVLENELTIGVHCYGKFHQRMGRPRINVPRAEWNRLQIFDPLIDTALFDRVMARRRASLETKMTDEALIEDLARLADRFGRLTLALVAEHAVSSPTVYVGRFGSLTAALRLAGQKRLRHNPQRWKARDITLAKIRPVLARLLKRNGYLSVSMVDRCPDLPRAVSLRKHIGPISSIFASVGDHMAPAEKIRLGQARGRSKLGGTERAKRAKVPPEAS